MSEIKKNQERPRAMIGEVDLLDKRFIGRTFAVMMAASLAVTGCAQASPNNQATKTNQSESKVTTKPKVVVPKGPLPGNLLIADRGNNHLLIVSPSKKILWQMWMKFPGPSGANSLGADDSFFTPDGKHIIINEEDNNVLAIIDIATKKIVWKYGHAGVAGSAQGYLNTPDDAYALPNGLVTTADIKNQRILFINKAGKVVKQYGTTGYRDHQPPKSFAAPNGDTPLPDGGMLITEIGSATPGGGYADRLTKSGKLVYSVSLPNIIYPSDTQLLKNGNLLVADYSTPGRLEEVNPRTGKVVWDYYKTSGPGELRNPSLTIPLPNGFVATNDDYNDRVVIINPKTNKIVWQYGHNQVASTKPGYLNTPDGMDFAPPTLKIP